MEKKQFENNVDKITIILGVLPNKRSNNFCPPAPPKKQFGKKRQDETRKCHIWFPKFSQNFKNDSAIKIFFGGAGGMGNI